MLVCTIYDIIIVVISYQAWKCTVRERADLWPKVIKFQLKVDRNEL